MDGSIHKAGDGSLSFTPVGRAYYEKEIAYIMDCFAIYSATDRMSADK